MKSQQLYRAISHLQSPVEGEMSDLKAERDWIKRSIKKIADETTDPVTKQKLVKILEHTDLLDANRLADYNTFIDIIFENQDNIQTLNDKITSLEEKLSRLSAELVTVKDELVTVKAELVTGKDELVTVKEELAAVTEEKRAKDTSALRRQIAINIEWELKADYLFLASSQEIQNEYLYAFGRRRGKVNEFKLASLSVDDARKRAEPNGVVEVERVWFGGPDKTRDELDEMREEFFDCMQILKRFSSEGAHPTVLRPNATLAEMVPIAKSLIRGLPLRETDDANCLDVAIKYVDKLHTIRQQRGQTKLLYSVS